MLDSPCSLFTKYICTFTGDRECKVKSVKKNKFPIKFIFTFLAAACPRYA